jgi:5-methylcytosine-specific restriction endonuclease McrA
MERDLEELVWRRSGGRCEYCQVAKEHDRLPFEVDHVIALKHGGPTRASNLCLACFACNNHKGPNVAGVDQQTNKIVSLFHPRRHSWRRHFRWDGPVLIGRTPAGRATVAVLEINLDYRIAFRQGLIDEGVFPPA